MANKSHTVQRPVYSYAAGAASADAGSRQFIRLLAIGLIMFVDVVITGTLNVTADGTGVRNRGSILAAFDEIGLVENGTDRITIDPRLARFIAETSAPSALTASRAPDATAANNANRVLTEYVRFWFAHPYSMNPRETAYLPRDPRSDLQIYFKLSGTNNGVGNIIAGGTKTLQNVQVRVVQQHDQFERERPLFIPTIRQITHQVNQAGDYEILLRPGNYVRALGIQQDTNVGEVSDIISTLALRGDTRDIIGPEPVQYDALRRSQEYQHGGAVYGASAPGYYLHNFQDYGRLANVWNPRQDTNLRLMGTAAPSGATGATTSVIRVALLELQRDPAWTDAQGQPLVGELTFSV